MTQPSQIVQAARVALWLSPLPATFPTDMTDPTPNWFNVGLTSPDSLKFKVTPEFAEVLAHQSDYPVKIIQTKDAAGFDIELMQWNGDNFKSVYGGGVITTITGPPVLYKFVPPSFGNRTEVGALIDVINGAKQYRFCVARAFQQSGVELGLSKSPESRLPLSLSILGGDAVDAWYMLTNDTAFTPPTP